MGVECTPPTCWRLGLGGLKAQWCWLCHARGRVVQTNILHKTKKIFFLLG
jgi:hypothetical protein